MAGETWFCVHCEDADVTSSDTDRCCLMCGVDLVSDQQLRATLQKAGLDLCTAAERKVLEACAEASRRLLAMIEALEADEDGTTDNDLLLVDLDGIRNLLARRGGTNG